MGLLGDVKRGSGLALRLAWVEDNYAARGSDDMAQANDLMRNKQWDALERKLNEIESTYVRLKWWQKILRDLSSG